jgi:acyl-CoA synthetase (AMP-forming)/AMP-acid ligase II
LSEGQIFISGPGVIKNYWGEAINNAGSIDTGDLGFLHDGNLFITGREKDLIIHAGVNLHPHWLEQAVISLSRFQSGPTIQASCVYSYKDSSIQREKIGVVVELRGRCDSKAFSSSVKKRILDVFSVPIDFVHVCKPGTIPRTTSGKIQRQMCAELFSD